MSMPDLNALLNRRIVIDSSGSMVYIGTLTAYDAGGYWLRDADVHDRADGHSTKEVYISEVAQMEKTGVLRINRRRVFVDGRAVMSISALEDVVNTEEPSDDADAGSVDEDKVHWLP